MNHQERKIRKALLQAKGTKADLLMVAMLYQVGSYQAAMEYIADLEKKDE